MCGDVCPKKSILFSEDSEGFFYPIVDESTCVDCGLCSQKCPALSVNLHEKPVMTSSAFASDASSKDSGSSGGVFLLLAIQILQNGGIVYGAAFDEQLKLKHHRVDSLDALRPLCKSKYLQSDCSGIYLQVKEYLKAGKQVMFVGTPCQCQALQNSVGTKLSDNLLLVDFVCHGVPNQNLFDDNLAWNTQRFGKVKSIEFRYKGKNVQHPQTLKMVYEKNGKEKSILRMHYQDPFYFGFQKHITLRPSCYQCQWAKPKRCSDITLADFWGIEKANIGLDSKAGVSCLLLNTQKGQEFFLKIREKLSGVNELPIDFAVENNSCLGGPTLMPKSREMFFAEYKAEGYAAVVDKYLVSKRKWVFDLYYAIPKPIRKIVRKLMEHRMKYE
ncbi:Ferredoxin-type protein NapF [Bacteroides pyogenes]|nr:Ferredoxin-type protein NapF [Bacteroides pyogenes]MBR8737768.1 Ferredoxin-type protein NapF [Bacteroides pyogenes]MBR8753459.1 Ferredoxin-type protein NapF [Bacteroides pyogenes]MBR8794867.1 Ferredoxin-type protein NapF [Bacteroides pyogenes]MBR8808396.1 Ferredoxin-type protein NapF [Bacteroides pyogenes]